MMKEYPGMNQVWNPGTVSCYISTQNPRPYHSLPHRVQAQTFTVTGWAWGSPVVTYRCLLWISFHLLPWDCSLSNPLLHSIISWTEVSTTWVRLAGLKPLAFTLAQACQTHGRQATCLTCLLAAREANQENFSLPPFGGRAQKWEELVIYCYVTNYPKT